MNKGIAYTEGDIYLQTDEFVLSTLFTFTQRKTVENGKWRASIVPEFWINTPKIPPGLAIHTGQDGYIVDVAFDDDGKVVNEWGHRYYFHSLESAQAKSLDWFKQNHPKWYKDCMSEVRNSIRYRHGEKYDTQM